LITFLLLLGSVVIYYYALAKGTHFERVPEKVEAER
jgi:hypothetical protein